MDSNSKGILMKDGNEDKEDPPVASKREGILKAHKEEDPPGASKREEILKVRKEEDPRAFRGYLVDETTVKLECCSRCEPYHGMCLRCWAPLPVEYGATPDFLSWEIPPTEYN